MDTRPDSSRLIDTPIDIAIGGPHRRPFFAVVLPGAIVVVAILASLSGCSSLEKIPDGSQFQSSTFGLKFAPAAPDGAPFILGSHSLIVTTAQPPDGGANLNRFEGKAPGVTLKSTVATGPVGEQLEAAGGAEAIENLLRDRSSGSARGLPPTTELLP